MTQGGAKERGMFAYWAKVTLAEILDGTSNTAMVAERVHGTTIAKMTPPVPVKSGHYAVTGAVIHTNPNFCRAQASGMYYNAGVTLGVCCNPPWGGNRWPDGSPAYASFTTVLPPNSPNCIDANHDAGNPIYIISSVSSFHPGGALVAMADGSVRFVNENIDTGNLSFTEVSSGPSPYGVWGAMGSKDGGEGTGNLAPGAGNL
ncbi:MAG: hypothetical protein B7Z73_09805 [Planctomycetia bacterium 21-64-5]|nr:MAG: hypothetical protein B7Z73_09805 [Planctomycetia bacterium 21-64-5]